MSQTDLKPPLRVGLLLDSYDMPAWRHQVLREIVESTHSRIALVVLNGARSDEGRPVAKPLERLWTNRRSVLYLLYSKLDARRHVAQPDALAKRDARELLCDLPVLTVVPEQTKYRDRFPDDDVRTIQSYDLDVIVRFGFRILNGEILSAARFGVWSYHHGDNRVNRGGPPAFWEVFERHPTTGAVLQRLNEDLDNGQVLARVVSGTHPTSARRNRNQICWKSVPLVARQLQALHDGTTNGTAAQSADRTPQFYSHPLYRPPDNRRFAPLLMKHTARRVASKALQRLYVDQWQIAYARGRDLSTSLWRFDHIVPPLDRFYADPYPMCSDEGHHVFVEEYLRDKGRISLLTIDPEGEVTDAEPVLERDHHLSSPFVLRVADEHYMIPESRASRNIEFYRATDYPRGWELGGTLMSDVSAGDTVLLEHDGRWWLFTNLAQYEGASKWDELHVFYADEPLAAAWTAHPLNPVVVDIRRARPAGRLFTRGGRLYRPGQDCSVRYGYGITIHEVCVLSPTEYREVPINHIAPNWHPAARGVHTINHVPGLTVVDVLMRRRRPGPWR